MGVSLLGLENVGNVKNVQKLTEKDRKDSLGGQDPCPRTVIYPWLGSQTGQKELLLTVLTVLGGQVAGSKTC